MEKYTFREAKLQDVPAISGIFDDAVTRMLAEGKQQWDENYPTEVHALADIIRHDGYVLEFDGTVVAYGAVIFSGEPAYEQLNGEWLSNDNDNYVVVHRMAVSRHLQGHGLARRFFTAVEHLATEKNISSFRVDTNFDNDRMLHLLERSGFDYCGKIHYEKGERMAFEKRI